MQSNAVEPERTRRDTSLRFWALDTLALPALVSCLQKPTQLQGLLARKVTEVEGRLNIGAEAPRPLRAPQAGRELAGAASSAAAASAGSTEVDAQPPKNPFLIVK